MILSTNLFDRDLIHSELVARNLDVVQTCKVREPVLVSVGKQSWLSHVFSSILFELEFFYLKLLFDLPLITYHLSLYTVYCIYTVYCVTVLKS